MTKIKMKQENEIPAPIIEITAKENSNIVISETAETLTKFYQQLTRKFLDILILKKLKEKQMRLCELAKSLKKEFLISPDIKKLHKTLKAMEKEKILERHELKGKSFYSLTNKGREIIEIIQEHRYQIYEMILDAIPR